MRADMERVTMSFEELFQELKSVMASIGLPEDGISPEAMREEAGLDSLAIAELVLVLRREKGVVVTEEEIHGAATVGEVAELIGEHLVASS